MTIREPGGQGLQGVFHCFAPVILFVWILIIDGVLVIIETEWGKG